MDIGGGPAIHASTSDEPLPPGVGPLTLRAADHVLRTSPGEPVTTTTHVRSAPGAEFDLANPQNRVRASLWPTSAGTVTVTGDGVTPHRQSPAQAFMGAAARVRDRCVKQSARHLTTTGNGGDLMQLDFDDTVLLGLHGYVRSVCRALGLRGECSYVQADGPVSAYIAVDERLRRFPDHDVALLWDEHHGWSAAIETQSGEELSVVAALGRDLLPAPETVAAWARDLFLASDTSSPGERPVLAGGDTLRCRLSAYIGDALSLPTGSRVHGSDGETLAIA